MAEDLNISRSKISSWETKRREIHLDDAIMISNYFDVSMDNLFNTKKLNSSKFLEIAKRNLNNEKISLEEKNNVLKEIHRYKSEVEYKEMSNESF